MQILTDGQIQGDITALDRAWDAEETFAFVPQKGGVSSEWLESGLNALPTHLHRDHFVLLTSGSTGQPKLIVGEKRRADALARALHTAQESADIAQTVAVLPLTYCYAFVNQWRWARTMGRELIMGYSFSDPDALFQRLEQVTDGMLCLVGAQVPLLLQYDTGRTFPGIRRLHFAGGRFPQDKLDALHRFFPNAQIYNNYGCAEAMPRLTLRKAEDASLGANVGRPLPGVEMMTSEDDRLLFRSPYGCVAYVDAEGYHAVTSEDWVPTGDLARSQPDGSWELLGRSNEVFKRYGEKISVPAVLATVMDRWSGQGDTYRETDPSGEMGYVLVLAPPPEDTDVRGILQALRASHTRIHWPLRIESLDELPRLPNGKIDRMRLGHSDSRQVHWRQRL